ncbi:Putative Serine/threonine kinase [Penicillium brasilianum]|uniref:Mitogen-activated protein kinase kinae kinase bck1 n=1 Tax=Penicillium brasilianum TaxID=104259 RepID=A0A0F7TLL0_PENBI|nr:Putative Serine/threonine kinase [Penicillium brasilianum]
MDGQRQYIPGPPPTQHPINLPPPPPRHPHQHQPVQLQTGVPPPPPGPPPGTGYGAPTGWQQSWGRQALPAGFPPPPPPPLPQNQHIAAYRPPAPLSIVPSHDSQPLTSATYIPGNDTIGVGIPPLFENNGQTYDPYSQQRQTSSQTYHPGTDGIFNPQTPGTRVTPPFALHNNVHELVTNDNSSQNPTPQNMDLTKSPSHRHQISGASLGGMSHSEAAIQWPLDRVLLWLARNGFSKDWQETFKSLELQGADFLELGLASGGRGNLGKIHKVVYPQLAKECARSGTGWDSTREREEGLRMRKLIRQIHDNESDSSISTPMRAEPPSWASTAAESGSGFHSGQLTEPRSAGPTPGVNDITPEQLSSVQGATASQKPPQMRSVTLPIPSGHDSPMYESPSRESPSLLRSDYSRSALATANDHRRQSPSISSENGAIPPSLRAQDSPKSGSPATQYVTPSYGGLTSSSTGDLTLKYEHSRVNSTESIPGAGRGSATMGRYYDSRRQGQDIPRPSPQDASKPFGGETSSSYSRDHGKSILNLFTRKKGHKTDLSSHPSPEDLESPPSPEARSNGYLPYQAAFNSSDMSLGERPSSATAVKTKKWIFATMDGVNYRLIDITEWDSAEALRAGICQNLGISDWISAQIFLTQPGQTEHEDPMSDSILAVSRRTKSDPYGSLKVFVKGAPTHVPVNHLPRFDGLGVSIPTDKAAQSPTAAHAPIHRKPLEEGAFNRLSPQAQTKPNSDVLGSRQNTLKASTGKTLPDGSPDPSQTLDAEKSDLLARHEAHMREVERKQKEHRISRVPPPITQQPRKDTYGETGYRREGVIDFDSPRISPYEEKKSEKAEILVPLRKPPVAPIESNTLTKVNSLRKAPGERADRHRPQPQSAGQTHGLGAVLASVGRMTSAIGTPSPSVPVPSTPSSNNRDSVGSDSDRPNTLDSAATASSRTTLDSGKTAPSFASGQVQRSPSSFASRSAANTSSPQSTISQKPTLQSRKSFGPEFDFEESQVSFLRSPGQSTGQPDDDDDDDDDSSDDGLFAIRPSRSEPQKPEPEPEKRRKPSLSLDTDNAKPRRVVSFISPNATSGKSFATPAGDTSGGDTSESPEKFSGTFYGADSSDDEQPPRRDSFANGDVWASRPAVEGVIDNLDSFFPDVDLDAPYLEEPPSPGNGKSDIDGGATIRGNKQEASPAPQPVVDLSTFTPDISTMRPPPPPQGASIVARRNVDRSGGLSRKKSIREVARGAAHRTKSIGSAGPQQSSNLLRRKSTKMFGAKIMQISPKPGTRLSQLDPIPQNTPAPGPSGSVPQRQPTFRIIRGQLIGKGTYGRVYLGMNADNGEVLAVKQVEINARIAGTDRDRIKEMVAALDQEIDTMQHLEHPNIVQYLGCERGEMSISIYLEYISGGSVGSCLRKHGKFEESVVRSLTRQTLDGLAYLHDMGILHRDLKADNILLDLDGTCKISDFGISKKTDDIYGNDSTNSMQGSVFWMAPEVIQSQGQGYSAKVDIWSLGCVVLEMFAGRRPWSKEEAIGAIFKLGSLNQAPPIPDDVSMNISPAALAFMYDCFTVDSSERPTAGTLLTRHPFCEPDPKYNFLDTELYAKIRHVL